MHLKDITGTLGNELAGRRVALCVTASVSITEAPRIARLLMRHGAEVITVLTPKAAQFVSPKIFEWSTGNPPITELTGKIEHVELISSSKVDLILVAPCTANTLAKIASGISDEPVSTLICTALGTEIPIMIASAMHEPMRMNPIIQQGREKLEKVGVRFIDGPFVESKSKLASPEEILQEILKLFGSKSDIAAAKNISQLSSESARTKTNDLADLSFLVTAGATREPIDNVRYITNASSGKMGVALAEEALSKGARSVCLIHGPGVVVPDTLKGQRNAAVESVATTEQMLDAVLSNLSKKHYDVFISAAAPADYAPTSSAKGKISTSENPSLNLHLVATKKIINAVKKKFPTTMIVAFKAEYGLDEEILTRRAYDSLKSSGAELVVANNVGRDDIGFGSDFNEVFIVNKEGGTNHLRKAPKREIASKILDATVVKIRQPPPSH